MNYLSASNRNAEAYPSYPGLITTEMDRSGECTWIYAKAIREPECLCPTCGEKAAGHGFIRQVFSDTPLEGRPVRLVVQIARWLCRNSECPARTFQTRPENVFDGKMTLRCRRYIEDHCFKVTFLALSKQTWVPESSIRRLAVSLLKGLTSRFRIDTPRVLSIDEIHLPSGKDAAIKAKKSQRFPDKKTKTYRTVFSNGETSQVVDVFPNRKGVTVFNALKNLQGYKSVKYVTMDMSENFRRAVKAAFGDQVIIIADRWHVTKAVNGLVETERKMVRGNQLAGARDLKRALSARSYMLRMNNPEKYRKLMEFLPNCPALSEAYFAKEELLRVYEEKTRSKAEEKFDVWLESARGNKKKHFVNLISTFENWRSEIFAYWDCRSSGVEDELDLDPEHPFAEYVEALPSAPFTNARAEARNRQLRHLNRNGRSYSFQMFRARAIFSTYEVWKQFDSCSHCSGIFRLEAGSSRQRVALANDAFAKRTGIKVSPTCSDCDQVDPPTRSGDKPVHSFATACGSADIWTDPEPAIADCRKLTEDAERRWRQLPLLPPKKTRLGDHRAQHGLPL